MYKPSYRLVVIATDGFIDITNENLPTVFVVTQNDSSFQYRVKGFKSGDRIVSQLSVPGSISNQESFADGEVSLQFAVDGVIARLTLIGLSADQDSKVLATENLNNLFGSGTYGLRASSETLDQQELLTGKLWEGEFGDDFIRGSRGADTIVGSPGNDLFDGDDGLDKVLYGSSRSLFDISSNTFGWKVFNRLSENDIDDLTGVERLVFRDVSVALDLDANAGTVVKILGAVFGKPAVANKAYVGIGLHYLDNLGYSYDQLIGLAVNAALGPTPTNGQVVDLLYKNVVGVLPDAATKAMFVGMLDRKEQTIGSLGVLAAETDLNKANIDLVGLAKTGLEYLPFQS